RAGRVALQPVVRVLNAPMGQAAPSPTPFQQGAAEHASERPQSEIAEVDADDAGENASGQAQFAALDQQPGRDAGRVSGDKCPQDDPDKSYHADSATRRTGRCGTSDSYSRATLRSVTSTTVRLTVAASSRSSSTLMSPFPRP